MLKNFRKVKRYFTDLTKRQKCVIVFFCFSALWMLGVLDRFLEKPFSEFEWPAADSRTFHFPAYISVPKCRKMDLLSNLMIIVKSSASNRQQRDSIRKTWGTHKFYENVEINIMFIIGKSTILDVNQKIEEEHRIFEDILHIDSIDSYRNNTLKLFASINYAVHPKNCDPPDYIFLVDDDYMVHIPNLVNFAKNKDIDDIIYEGFVFETSPFRFKLHKHRISLEEYPYSEYPPYVSAGAVFLSSKAVKLFHQAIPKLKIFPFDDVYTGIVAKYVGISPIHNPNFVFWSKTIPKSDWDHKIIAAHGYGSPGVVEKTYSQIFNF